MGKVTKVEVPLPADDLPTHTRLCTKRLGITGYYLFRHIWLFRYWHSLFPCTVSIMIAMEPCDD